MAVSVPPEMRENSGEGFEGGEIEGIGIPRVSGLENDQGAAPITYFEPQSEEYQLLIIQPHGSVLDQSGRPIGDITRSGYNFSRDDLEKSGINEGETGYFEGGSGIQGVHFGEGNDIEALLESGMEFKEGEDGYTAIRKIGDRLEDYL